MRSSIQPLLLAVVTIVTNLLRIPPLPLYTTISHTMSIYHTLIYIYIYNPPVSGFVLKKKTSPVFFAKNSKVRWRTSYFFCLLKLVCTVYTYFIHFVLYFFVSLLFQRKTDDVILSLYFAL